MPMTLYYHPLASFCHKPLIALYELEIPFDKQLIDLGDEADRAALQALWPIGKFPVLRDGARIVPESSTIIEYLDRDHGTLVPVDWEGALLMRQWDRHFDNYVQVPMQEIVLDRIKDAGADLAPQRAMLATSYAMIEAQLAGKTWIAGDAFSMADCAAAPALFYASTLVPFSADRPLLQAYFERLAARPSVARVLEEAKPYLHFYPFADAVPARFR